MLDGIIDLTQSKNFIHAGSSISAADGTSN
jgi:hypothetical protein